MRIGLLELPGLETDPPGAFDFYPILLARSGWPQASFPFIYFEFGQPRTIEGPWFQHPEFQNNAPWWIQALYGPDDHPTVQDPRRDLIGFEPPPAGVLAIFPADKKPAAQPPSQEASPKDGLPGLRPTDPDPNATNIEDRLPPSAGIGILSDVMQKFLFPSLFRRDDDDEKRLAAPISPRHEFPGLFRRV